MAGAGIGGAILSGFLQGFSQTYLHEKDKKDAQKRDTNRLLAHGILQHAMSDPSFEMTPETEKLLSSVYGKEGAKLLGNIHQNWMSQMRSVMGGDSGAATFQPTGEGGFSMVNPQSLNALAGGGGGGGAPGGVSDAAITRLAFVNPRAAAILQKQQASRQAAQMVQGTRPDDLPEGMSVHYGPVTVHGIASDETRYNRARVAAQAKSDVELGGGSLGAPAVMPDATGSAAIDPASLPANGAPPRQAGQSPAVYKKQLEMWAKTEGKLDQRLDKDAPTWVTKDGLPESPGVTHRQAIARGSVSMTAKQTQARDGANGFTDQLLWPMLNGLPQFKGEHWLYSKTGGRLGRAIKTYAGTDDDLNQLQLLRDNVLTYLRTLRDEKGQGFRGDLINQAGQSFPQNADSEEQYKSKIRYWARVFRGIYVATGTPEPPSFRDFAKSAERSIGKIDPERNLFGAGEPEASPSGAPSPAPPGSYRVGDMTFTPLQQ